jgi:hypothetical protein
MSGSHCDLGACITKFASMPDDPGHRKLLKTFALQAFLPVGATDTRV